MDINYPHSEILLLETALFIILTKIESCANDRIMLKYCIYVNSFNEDQDCILALERPYKFHVNAFISNSCSVKSCDYWISYLSPERFNESGIRHDCNCTNPQM